MRPLGGPASTIMVTGAPWPRPAPAASPPLKPLGAVRAAELLGWFRARYPR